MLNYIIQSLLINKINIQEWSRILNKRYLALPALVKKIHVDIEENRNLYVQNMNDTYMMVFDGFDWKAKDIKNTLDEILIDNTNRIYEFINDPSIDIKKNLYDKINEIIDKIDKDDNIRESYKEKLKMELLNNKRIIREYYEKSYNKKIED